MAAELKGKTVVGDAPEDLKKAAIEVGYYNGYNTGESVYEVAKRLSRDCPKGFRVMVKAAGFGPPDENIRIGQYKVRSGDPDFPLYVVRA